MKKMVKMLQGGRTAAPARTRAEKRARGRQRRRRVLTKLNQSKSLYLFLIPAIVYFIIFCYLPMYGVQIAFKYYSPRLGIWGSTWTGMENLNRFFDSYYFWRLLRNTVGLSLYNLIVAFPFPILLALVFNEVKSPKLKKAVQTISYAPHFISVVVLVGIFTKIEMHATLCIEAAAAGKHIFSQKPFAYNIEEGRKIIRAVDEAGVKLTPSFMHSYMDGSIAARRIVEEGKIGEIRHIRMRNATKNPFDSAPGYGGCMMDIGCHGMDLIHTVAGSSIEEVFALHLSPRDEKRREEFGERANLNGVENTAILNYRLASGATVFHEVFWTQVAQTNRFEMEIYGAKGVIYLYNPHRSDIVYYGWNLDGHPRKDIHWQAAPVDPQFFGYIHHKTFVDDLLNGTNNSKTARDAFVPLQVVEAARRSFESGRIERVLGI